uniref:glycosyltransferase family 61 protein n=1 Tax=Orrella sp. TaxID=1921583 RepID=UPI0040553A1C
MSDLFKINLIEILPPKLAASTLDRLQKTWIGIIYLKYLKPIPIVRGGVIRAWRLLLPLYAKVLAGLPTADSARAWHPIIKMQDFVLANQCIYQQIFEPVRVKTPAPKVLPAEDQALLVAPHDHYVFPSIYVAELGQATVCGGSNLVFVDGAVICHDLYDFERDYTSEEMHGRHFIEPTTNRMLLLHKNPEPSKIDCAASFEDACAPNYAHWITEVLPRVAVFCDVSAYAEVPIIVNAGLHPNIMQSLSLVVGNQRKVIALPVGRSITVNNLVQTSVTGYVPFERRNDKLQGYSHGMFSSLAFASLSAKIKPYMNQPKHEPWPSKIYLRRNSGIRKVLNIDEVENVLFSNGYVAVESEKLDFIQQASIFHDAQYIIGSSGAALANFVFCGSKTKIDIMIGRLEGTNYWYWQNMAASVSNDVTYYLGRAQCANNGVHSDFYVDLNEFNFNGVAL